MGFLQEEHTKKFLKGKTIKELSYNKEEGSYSFQFTDGEKLNLYLYSRYKSTSLKDGAINISVVPEIITTPINKDGTIKQSTEILGD